MTLALVTAAASSLRARPAAPPPAVAPSLGAFNQAFDIQGAGSNPLTVAVGATQAAGSSLLIFSASKLDEVAASNPLTHNKTGTVAFVSSLAYAAWAPYGARMDWVPDLAGGSGQTASLTMLSSQATGEKTIFAMEVKNGRTLSLVTPTELVSAATPTCADVTTTGPAVLFCCVWGDANISPTMDLLVHADALAAGWVQIGDVSIGSDTQHIQGALAARVVSGAGTHSGCEWALTPSQRLLVFTGSVQA